MGCVLFYGSRLGPHTYRAIGRLSIYIESLWAAVKTERTNLALASDGTSELVRSVRFFFSFQILLIFGVPHCLDLQENHQHQPILLKILGVASLFVSFPLTPSSSKLSPEVRWSFSPTRQSERWRVSSVFANEPQPSDVGVKLCRK